jgi:hypothetical protein
MEIPLYNELSKSYDELFIRNINKYIINSENQENANVDYNVFYPSFGVRKNEPCEFLIYGQACNEWPVKFNTKEHNTLLNTKELLLEAKVYSNGYYEDGDDVHNPLDWINIYWSKKTYKENVQTLRKLQYYDDFKYKAYSSFFWNVIYKTISDYYHFDRNKWCWSSKLVWSNLYKIAPTTGNPSNFEKSLQEIISVQLVKMEIEEINPKYCIVLTNREWWEPFQHEFNLNDFGKNEFSEIEAVQKYKNTIIIITTRPFRSGNEKHVSQILEVIKKFN